MRHGQDDSGFAIYNQTVEKVKDEERILKAARRSDSSIRLTADCSLEVMEARKQWDDRVKLLTEKKHPPGVLYWQKSPSKLKETLRHSQQNTYSYKKY